MESTSKSKIAVIGLGAIGQVVAGNFVKGNRPVIIADRNIEKAKELSGKWGNLAQPMGIGEAIKASACWKITRMKHAARKSNATIVSPILPSQGV